ncbi:MULTISPECIES: hypothetical protein [Hydrogenophaga]|uniref:Uncharacterized protein n=1 Tax=Hydrogenophaga intermedia TaxID=65786 RepID=A0A1L1PKR7_HYDIT|nr:MULTISPECIES: hypothetical protein [Hydrogenophaga]AOS80833.1 hypothetical protein Q5W_18620 [Hydrogenophaga sp. PBC]TMU72044.1 hypothetical protein FGJ01_20535 [Hydrogenophaga intermedia]CDN89980.1 hypothetical protein BN948_04420 [Hydrogenophaga intermedia]
MPVLSGLLLSSPPSTGAAFAVNAVHGTNGQLVWANSPKAGFALNVATAGEVQAPTALRQNFHVQLAQSTSQGMFLLGQRRNLLIHRGS